MIDDYKIVYCYYCHGTGDGLKFGDLCHNCKGSGVEVIKDGQ